MTRWPTIVALTVYGTVRGITGAVVVLLSRWYGRTVG